MNGTLAAKRADFYRMVYNYKRKREALKKEYGTTGNPSKKRPVPEGYKRRAEKIKNKIKHWNREIKRIDIKTKKMSFLLKVVRIYTKCAIRYTVNKSPEVKQAKAIYFKYGIEQLGLYPRELRLYISPSNTDNNQAQVYRSRFTKAMVENPELKQYWLNFKKYYEKRANPKPRKPRTRRVLKEVA